MTDVSAGTQTQDVVLFCQQCGSPSVEVEDGQVLTGTAAKASCKACGWSGLRSDLIGVPFTHEFSSQEEIIRTLMGELRVVLAKTFAPTFAPFLAKWGFLDDPPTSKQLGRYVAAVAASILQAVILERQKMAKEAVDGHVG